jgi:hypothetical protein
VCYPFPVSRTLLALLLACAAAVAAGACQRPTAEQCARICWRSNEIGFWERFETEARNLAPAKRDELRAERQKIWNEIKARKFDPLLENCLKECRRSGAAGDVECVEKARTVAQIKDCLD